MLNTNDNSVTYPNKMDTLYLTKPPNFQNIIPPNSRKVLYKYIYLYFITTFSFYTYTKSKTNFKNSKKYHNPFLNAFCFYTL